MFRNKYFKQILVENKILFGFLARSIFILVFALLSFLPRGVAQAATGSTYYVSPFGNDNNPGTLSAPWKTINKAASKVISGDTVYIRGGVYQEVVNITASGTSSSPIRFINYPGETPIIDGSYTIPGYGGYLLCLRGSYLYVSGIEIRNSSYGGVFISGDFDVVDNVFVHHSMEPGIIITRGQHSIVENSRIWRNSLSNEGGGHAWSCGISAGRDGVSYVIIRNNTVWENWGEGISTGQSTQIVIDHNIVHDNYSTNIYITDATNIICQRNLVYMDPNSYVYGAGSNVGIMMGDETYNPPSANIQVINNIAYGNHRNFHWWQGTSGGGMNNVLIANNTFFNGTGNVNNGEGNVIISRGSHVNVRFENNLVSQDSSLPVIATIAQAGVYYSNNLWSKNPYTAASGPGDVIGDPGLAKIDSPYSADWYLLTDASPAIDMGLSLGEVSVDYFGTSRGSPPDIGAVEYDNAVSNPVNLTISKTGTGSGTVTSAPAGINCGATCSRDFSSGTSVTLTAAATPGGYDRFLGWSGGGCSGTEPCTLTLSDAAQVGAEFEKATFSDVPFTHPRWAYVEALWEGGYTSGCSSNPLRFCPDQTMSRAESAVFMLRGNFGPGYAAPAEPWDRFADDWTPGPWAEKWAEGMWNEGMTAGCSTDPLKFCPWDLFPRVQGAVIGLRMKYGMSYVPPNATGTLFADMTDADYWGTKWAEQAYLDGLLPACGTQGGKPKFCPNDLLDRSWSAYLIGQAKGLPLP